MTWPPIVDRDVLQHLLLAIAIARRLDREHIKDAAQFIDDECRERLAVHVVGDDDEIFLAGLRDFFKSGRISLTVEIFLSVMRIGASFASASMRSALVII